MLNLNKRKAKKRQFANDLNMRLGNLEGKTPKNKSNSDMLVDAELEGGEKEEEAAVVEKKTTNK